LSVEFEQALKDLDEFSAAQGVTAADALSDDDFEQLAYRWQLTNVRAALRGAIALVRAGAAVELRLVVGDTESRLRADGPDRWQPVSGPDPASVLEHLHGVGPKVAWTTDQLLQGDSEAGLSAVESAEAGVELAKSQWTDPISKATGRSVWIGPTLVGFAAWLAGTVPEQIASKLFSKPGALVLLAELPAKTTMRARERMTIGSLVERAPAVSDSELLTTRLEERGERKYLPAWRLIHVEADPSVPVTISRPLARAIGMTAAKLIAEVQDGENLRPSADEATEWSLPRTPGDGEADVDAIVQLARWVGADLSESRLGIARDLAARRLPDPLHGGAAEPLLDAARIAHRLAVHGDVIEALERQQRLEELFRELDDKAAAMRSSINETLDASVTKALAGALAVTIAALTSAKVRDWPATVAAFVLAGYLAINAIGLASWRREDADARLRDAGRLASARVETLGNQLEQSTETWRALLRTRVRRATTVLWILAVLLVAGGLFGNGPIRRFVGIEHQAKSKNKPALTPGVPRRPGEK
jgi:hypothetical protein